MTSLRELASLEAARVRDLAEATKRRRDQERANADAEAAARREIARAGARRIEEQAALRAERDRAEEASRLAQAAATIAEARVAAEHQARAEEATRAHERALELLAAGRAAAPRRARLVAFLGVTLALVSAAVAAITTARSRAHEVEAWRAHGADAEAITFADGELRAAKETIARLDAQLVEARSDARTTRAVVDQARQELDALRAACRRGNLSRAPTGRSSSSNKQSDPLGASGCKPGDPLCGMIGPPGR